MILLQKIVLPCSVHLQVAQQVSSSHLHHRMIPSFCFHIDAKHLVAFDYLVVLQHTISSRLLNHYAALGSLSGYVLSTVTVSKIQLYQSALI